MSLINPEDSLERQNEKLLTITRALMRKVEQKNEQSGIAYAQFERAALLEAQVQERTKDLARTLDLLQDSNAQLETANLETETARANLTEAIETISEGFALFDPDDKLVLFNSRFCRDLRDIPRDQFEGLAFAEYVQLVAKSIYLELPEGVTPFEWALKRTHQHREDRVVFNVSLTKDRWLQVSEHRTAQRGTVILQTDVTNIIRLERQERDRMRDQQARVLRATLDHLNQGVCIFNSDRELIGWNKQMNQLLDLPSRQDAMGENFLSLLEQLEGQLKFSGTTDANMLRRWAERSSGRPAITVEVTRDSTQTLSVFAQEMPDLGFVISFTDVTAEREAATALNQVNEMLERRVDARTKELGVALSEAERANASKSRFVAAASHDLLQPLSAAKLFVSSLSDQISQPNLTAVIDKAETALASVEQIIEALLDISKLDSPTPELDVRPVSLSAILAPLRDELTPVAEAKGLGFQILDSSLNVFSDPGYLRRIIQNLVSNAIRYTDQGRVLVGVRRNGPMVRVEIWDTGRGIAKEDQENIFQEFKRIDKTTSDTGLGLGLAIVERACNRLDHKLELCSKFGQGSRFSVELPIKVGHEVRVLPPRDKTEDDQLVQQGQIVFLVENDLQLANAMTMAIEQWGGHVIHARTGTEALQLLSEIDLKPDALLLDYHLDDDMVGTELFAMIKDIYGPIPARLISANRSASLQDECEAVDLPCIPKPIDRNELRHFLNLAAQWGRTQIQGI
ncbi:MAG: PAS-domain containing protein [Pikeienuella sp.]